MADGTQLQSDDSPPGRGAHFGPPDRLAPNPENGDFGPILLGGVEFTIEVERPYQQRLAEDAGSVRSRSSVV